MCFVCFFRQAHTALKFRAFFVFVLFSYKHSWLVENHPNENFVKILRCEHFFFYEKKRRFYIQIFRKHSGNVVTVQNVTSQSHFHS